MAASCHYKYYLAPAPKIPPKNRDREKGKKRKKNYSQ